MVVVVVVVVVLVVVVEVEVVVLPFRSFLQVRMGMVLCLRRNLGLIQLIFRTITRM